jgi:hypothetical protein
LIRTNYERGFSFRYLYKKKIVKKINYFDIAHVNIFHQSLFKFLHIFSLFVLSGLENESRNENAENRTSWLLHEGVGDDQIIQKQQQEAACFAETSTKIEKEIRSLQRMSSCKSDSSSSSLPAWLQQYKNENKGITYNDQVSLSS